MHSTRLIERALLKIKSTTVISIRSDDSGSCLVPRRVSWACVGGGLCAATHLFLSKCNRELIPELDGDSSNARLHSEESGPGSDHNVAKEVKVLAPAIDDVLLKRCTKRNVRKREWKKRENNLPVGQSIT